MGEPHKGEQETPKMGYIQAYLTSIGGNVTEEGLKNVEEIPKWLDFLAKKLDL